MKLRARVDSGVRIQSWVGIGYCIKSRDHNSGFVLGSRFGAKVGSRVMSQYQSWVIETRVEVSNQDQVWGRELELWLRNRVRVDNRVGLGSGVAFDSRGESCIQSHGGESSSMLGFRSYVSSQWLITWELQRGYVLRHMRVVVRGYVSSRVLLVFHLEIVRVRIKSQIWGLGQESGWVWVSRVGVGRRSSRGRESRLGLVWGRESRF